MTTESIDAIRRSLKDCNDAILICRSDHNYALLHQRDRLERKLQDALVASRKPIRIDRDIPTMDDMA